MCKYSPIQNFRIVVSAFLKFSGFGAEKLSFRRPLKREYRWWTNGYQYSHKHVRQEDSGDVCAIRFWQVWIWLYAVILFCMLFYMIHDSSRFHPGSYHEWLLPPKIRGAKIRILLRSLVLSTYLLLVLKKAQLNKNNIYLSDRAAQTSPM